MALREFSTNVPQLYLPNSDSKEYLGWRWAGCWICWHVRGLDCSPDGLSYNNIKLLYPKVSSSKCSPTVYYSNYPPELTWTSCSCCRLTSTWWLSNIDRRMEKALKAFLVHKLLTLVMTGFGMKSKMKVQWSFYKVGQVHTGVPFFFPLQTIAMSSETIYCTLWCGLGGDKPPTLSAPLDWLDSGIIYQTITRLPPTTNGRWTQTSVKPQRLHEELTVPSRNTATDSEAQTAWGQRDSRLNWWGFEPRGSHFKSCSIKGEQPKLKKNRATKINKIQLAADAGGRGT